MPQGDQDDIDVADESEETDSASELEVAFADGAAGSGHDGGVPADQDNADGQDDAFVKHLGTAFDELAGDAGLEGGREDGDGDGDAGGAAASHAGALEGEGPHRPGLLHPVPPWELCSEPSDLGYVSLGGKTVMRIQRNVLPHSVRVTCYRHTACSLTISAERCPSDSVLKRWLFEVPANPPAVTPELKKELSTTHKDLGRSRWYKHGVGGRASGAG